MSTLTLSKFWRFSWNNFSHFRSIWLYVLRKIDKHSFTFLISEFKWDSEYFDEKIPLSCYHCDHRFNEKGCWFIFLNRLIRSRTRDIVLQTPLGSSNIHVHQNFSALGIWWHFKKSLGNNFRVIGQLPNGLPPGYATGWQELHGITLIHLKKAKKRSSGCVLVHWERNAQERERWPPYPKALQSKSSFLIGHLSRQRRRLGVGVGMHQLQSWLGTHVIDPSFVERLVIFFFLTHRVSSHDWLPNGLGDWSDWVPNRSVPS
jgi:hypothetical protein